MPKTVLSGVLGRELLDGGKDTTRNPGDEARTKRENDIKRRVGCGSKQGMAPDQLKLKILNDNPYPRPRKGKKYHEVLRKIDNLAEIAGAFAKMVTVRQMKQIVPECKSNDSGDEGMDNNG